MHLRRLWQEQISSDKVEDPTLEKYLPVNMTRLKVFKKHGDQRPGKGFSLEELQKAGTNFKEVMDLGIPTDPRRKTAHQENIEVIKALLKNRKTVSKPRKTTRKPKR